MNESKRIRTTGLIQRWIFPAILVAVQLFAPHGPRAQEPQPADLVDVVRLQGLSLEDLGWQEESRVEGNEAIEIRGSWLGPMYDGYDNSGREVHVQFTESARIWIPASETAGTTIHQVVVANHEEHYLDRTRNVYPELASNFPVACIRHAQKSADWTSLGIRGRNHWALRLSRDDLRRRNPCEPEDFEFANYPNALVKTQIMALTLLSRILEEWGYVPGPAGMLGNSKEGFSTWAAAAIDDRLVAIAPGGYPGSWLPWYQTSLDNQGCNAGDGMWPTTLAWFKTTEAGRGFLKYSSVSEFAGFLKPEFCLMWGDVGLAGLHDGDAHLAPAYNLLIEDFSAIPHRFDRLPDLHERETSDEYRNRLVGLLAHYLVTREILTHPEIGVTAVEAESTRFRTSAQVSPEAEAVRLWWSHSTSRRFSDPGNAPWLPVEMTLDGDTWVAPWVDIPSGEMIGWYVEAESALNWEGLRLVQRDSSPQKFFNEFPLLSCALEVPDCSPPAAPTGLVTGGEVARVVLDWDDHVEGASIGYHVKRSEVPGGQYVLVAEAVIESEYTDTDVVPGTTYYYVVTAVDPSGNESGSSSEAVATPLPVVFIRGNCNGDDAVDISDPVTLITALFGGLGGLGGIDFGAVNLPVDGPDCVEACNANNDLDTDVSDISYLVSFLFLGGAPPGAPFPECGTDPDAAASLGCQRLNCGGE